LPNGTHITPKTDYVLTMIPVGNPYHYYYNLDGTIKHTTGSSRYGKYHSIGKGEYVSLQGSAAED
ncbi:MAG: hypothetical protein ACK5MR_10180, partial [Cumulibacter sp.]